jgi:hypothetical protein
LKILYDETKKKTKKKNIIHQIERT